MEKLRPHYPLSRIKSLIIRGSYKITVTAVKCAYEDFLMTEEGILNKIINLEMSNFYKSMTSKYDTALWHDVYHVSISKRIAYIKVQIFDEVSVIISFKEK
jgi:motility quorum-sensing regulator / GCU-specific mRNA interferase toxin